jgi:hypothetical protein
MNSDKVDFAAGRKNSAEHLILGNAAVHRDIRATP